MTWCLRMNFYRFDSGFIATENYELLVASGKASSQMCGSALLCKMS